MKKSNGEFPDLVTKSDLLQVCYETQDMINGLRIAHNTLAEVCQLHRYLLERFIPASTLTAAVNEYAEKRALGIAEEQAQEAALHAAATKPN